MSSFSVSEISKGLSWLLEEACQEDLNRQNYFHFPSHGGNNIICRHKCPFTFPFFTNHYIILFPIQHCQSHVHCAAVMIRQNDQVHYVPKRRSEVGGYDGGGGGGWSEEKRDDREESITSWADETEMELERQMKSMELEKEQQQQGGGGGRGVSGAGGSRGGRGRGARGRGWNNFSHGEHDDRIGGPEDGDLEYVRFVQILPCFFLSK